MSIAAIGSIAGPALFRGARRFLGRKGRQRARMAAPAPGIVGRTLALARRVGVALPAGAVDPRTGMPRRRRRRGITAAEIRGFKKLSRLLSQFGMRPRGLARPMARGRRPFSRARFGDPEGGDLGDE